MSLYKTLFGENPDTNNLLGLLDLSREDFGRFRDIFLNADGTEIIVYTRCGGFNRDDYKIVFDHMKDHPYYITNYDDEFDETYCYFLFDVPKEYLTITRKVATGTDPLTVSEKFKKEIKEMEDPNSEASKRAAEIAKKIEEGITSQPNGGIIWM